MDSGEMANIELNECNIQQLYTVKARTYSCFQRKKATEIKTSSVSRGGR